MVRYHIDENLKLHYMLVYFYEVLLYYGLNVYIRLQIFYNNWKGVKQTVGCNYERLP